MGCLRAILAIFLAAEFQTAWALPRKGVNQYTHRVWTQAQGLPQDTVRAITQTTDGYLWVGTDEGLARFDGYRFVSFGKRPGELPDAAVTSLCAGDDGSLWVGSAGALTWFKDGVFRSWGAEAGFGEDALISDIRRGPDGSIWIATGLRLVRYQGGKFSQYNPASGSGIQGIRVVLPENDGTVWVAGYGSIGRLQGSELVRVFDGAPLNGNIAMRIDRHKGGGLLLSGTEGLFEVETNRVRRYTNKDGLPDTFVRSFLEDRYGDLWVGTNSGLARRERGRFLDFSRESLYPHEWVWTIFEDRDGNLWVGANSGLHQFLDQPITVYTRADGLPSDQPTAVHQDRRNRVWIGFHDQGVGYFDGDKFMAVRGLPSQEVFSIRETPSGDLLIGTRGGLSRIHDGIAKTEFIPTDELGRHNVFDAMEDSQGRLWMGTNQGALVLSGSKKPEIAIPGGVLLSDAVVTLLETRDRSIWTGVYGRGLWQLRGRERRHYTIQDGLAGEGVRSLYEDEAGALWVGTFNGGAACLRDGKFLHIDSHAGLPSDIVGRILEESGDLWFATARGIARVSRPAFEAFWSDKSESVYPVVYSIAEGLRSAQGVPGYPTGTGGTRTADGRLWFPTGYGLAIFDPDAKPAHRNSPAARVVEVFLDGRAVDLSRFVEIPADTRRIEFRFAGVELTSPESVQYQFRLDGVDRDWVQAYNRRSTEYNNLPYGTYKFRVKASLAPESKAGPEAVLTFRRLPHWWDLRWIQLAAFALAATLVWGTWQMRLRQERDRFGLVLAERSRLAREIHDTLAQGFVGISSQLDAVALMLRNQPEAAAKHLDLARRMSQHSLTEARRSIFDLRESEDSNVDLASSIRGAVKIAAAGRDVKTDFDLDAIPAASVNAETSQHIVRIVQEAAANAARHAAPKTIRTRLQKLPNAVQFSVHDDGSGFDASEAMLASGGHFGLLGMRERAERINGTFELLTSPGEGTTIRVTVPLSS